MKKSVTQEFDYGCGVACFAFVTGLSYRQAVHHLGREQTVKFGWRPSDLSKALNDYGLRYKNSYVRKHAANDSYPNGTIVLIERSKDYKVGHYLVSYERLWMDPWINMTENNDIYYAKSGFRKVLPGKAMYAIVPLSPAPRPKMCC